MGEKLPRESDPRPKDKTIKQMRRELSIKFHPDRQGDAEIMKEVNAVYKLAERGDERKLRELYKLHSSGATGGAERRVHKPLTEEELRKKIRGFQLLGKYEENPKSVGWLMEYLLGSGEITKERYERYLRERTG